MGLVVATDEAVVPETFPGADMVPSGPMFPPLPPLTSDTVLISVSAAGFRASPAVKTFRFGGRTKFGLPPSVLELSLLFGGKGWGLNSSAF